MPIKPVGGEIQSQELNDNFSFLDSQVVDATAKANNPIGTMQSNGQKIPLDSLSNEVIDAMTGTTGITTAKGYFENNRGVDYPMKNVVFNGSIEEVPETVKNAILDAKVFGAKLDCYYRLTMISNGFDSNGKQRWGVTLEERTKDTFAVDGGRNTFIFIYNDDSLAGNSGNANWQKVSDNIETITVDNGEIALSLTVDRSVITNSAFPEFLNFNTRSPSVIIDPSNYFF